MDGTSGWVWTAMTTGLVSFAATNIDDIFVLMLLYGDAETRGLRTVHVVAGQYLGFAALIAVSLLGYAASFAVPEEWVGLLGLLPIAIGIKKFVEWRRGDAVEKTPREPAERGSVLAVAAVTVANGGDNIGVYAPLFAASRARELAIVLVLFAALIAIWCVAGRWLSKNRYLAALLDRYGHMLVPIVLVGLGGSIIYRSGALRLFS